MEVEQRSTIRKCRVRLVKDLMIDEMFDSIEAQDIFTPVMLEYIKAKESRPEKVRVFLDYLQRRGPDAFDKFLQCLRESGHNHIASYVVQEYMILSGKGIAKLDIQHKSEVVQQQAVGSRPNMYITQETQAATGPLPEQNRLPAALGESGGQVQVGRQEVGSSMEESSESQEEEGFKSVCCSEEDMDTDLTSAARLTGVQVSSSYRSERSGSNISEGSGSELTSRGSSVSLNTGYTGNFEEEYRMESDPRGLLLIINNKLFCGPLSDREGTDVDCENLRKLFMSLGFGVDMRHNLTALEIKVNLTILAQHNKLREVDCLAVAILTHGSEEYLYGVDGKYFHVNEAFKPFNAENCPALHHKPKFFIINACRGDTEDKGIHASGQYESSTVQDTEPIPSCERDRSLRIPNMQDFLLAYSTIPGHVSWRHMNDGSWFIQGLVKVFGDCAYTKDALTMLTKVNNEVSRNISHVGVQIPAPQFMLTKTWYLNPIPREPV